MLLVLDAALALGIVVLDVERAAGMVRFLRRLKYIAKLPAKISRVPHDEGLRKDRFGKVVAEHF